MCGIVGLIGAPNASQEAFLALTTLQHRGQDGAGILTVDDEGFHLVKNIGLVEGVFNRENIQSLTGSLCVAHTRYSTVGRGQIADIQPFKLSFPFGLGLAHNGNLVNVEPLYDELRKKEKRVLSTRSDSEVILNWLAIGLQRASHNAETLSFEEICKAVELVFEKANGSFSIASIIAGHGLLAFRDPHGIRPLVLGRKKGGTLPTGEAWMATSESVALMFNGYESLGSLEPGEVVFIDLQGRLHRKRVAVKTHRPCMFEWVYFASPESELDRIPVYGSRIALGREIARLVSERLKAEGMEPDMVVPVPETSRIAAIALSEELKVPYREVLIKNRYIKRTFILDSQAKRDSAVNLKLSPVESEIRGKRICLVDDSIVRGTTSRKLIELVRRAGAKEVYFVSTCPPIQHPCYYGIDFPSGKELIAFNKSSVEIEKELGADALIYLDQEGLKKALLAAGAGKVSELNPCMACLDGKYPTDITIGKQFAASREADRGKT